MQQHERRAGPGLAIGNPGTVVVVIEPQSHQPGSSHYGGERDRQPIAVALVDLAPEQTRSQETRFLRIDAAST